MPLKNCCIAIVRLYVFRGQTIFELETYKGIFKDFSYFGKITQKTEEPYYCEETIGIK